MKLQKLKNFLQSDYSIILTFVIAFLGWVLNLYLISISLLTILFALTYIFCDDIKTSFASIFYLPFFINKVEGTATFIIYGICIGIGIGSILFLIIKNLKKKKTFNKGKMFWALIISAIAYLLGGIYKNFHFPSFIITLAFCLVCYIVYWLAINFTTNLKHFLYKMFLYGSFYLAIQILLLIILQGNIVEAISTRSVVWVGAQNINVACIYLTLGIISCFALGFKTKNDWKYFLLSLFITCVVYITYCRMMVLIAFLIFAILSIITFVKSNNKKIFILIISFALICLALFWAIFPNYINKIINSLISRGFKGNGRESLWSWCWNKFKQFPVFGVGFYSPEKVPSLQGNDSIIFAHNTALQWLTSLGIIGSILMLYFYFKKYHICFKNYNFSKFFLIVNLIMIELSGVTDQAASMDTFVYLISLILIVALEKEFDLELKQINNFENKSTIKLETNNNSNNIINNKNDNITNDSSEKLNLKKKVSNKNFN